MLLFKFLLVLVFLCTLPPCNSSYVYPLWGQTEHNLAKAAEPTDSDATLAEFIIANFVIPTRDSFCNICANFLEVYTCILENVKNRGENIPQESESYLDMTLNLLGLKGQQPNTSQTCSYYSFMVVTTAIVLFLGLLFITKKVVDHVKDEDRVFPQMLSDYKNKCPCYEMKELKL